MERIKITVEAMKERLKAAGVQFEPVETLYQPYQCETCRDQGSVVLDVPLGHEDFGRVFECPNEACFTAAQRREARFRRLAVQSQLPPEYQRFTFRLWNELSKDEMGGKWDALSAARAFVLSRDRNYWFTLEDAAKMSEYPSANRAAPPDAKNSLVLQGAPGIGKTSLAACIVNALLDVGEAVVYVRAAEILDSMFERFEKQSKADYEFEYGNTVQAIKGTFQRAPVLVIDEFNLRKYSDFTRQTMEDILRYRNAHHMPTVMTCNIDFETFQDENDGWGYRTGHVVQQMSHWIVMGGVELRRRNHAVLSR
jgi:DNA replication protein DnaC